MLLFHTSLALLDELQNVIAIIIKTNK